MINTNRLLDDLRWDSLEEDLQNFAQSLGINDQEIFFIPSNLSKIDQVKVVEFCVEIWFKTIRNPDLQRIYSRYQSDRSLSATVLCGLIDCNLLYKGKEILLNELFKSKKPDFKSIQTYIDDSYNEFLKTYSLISDVGIIYQEFIKLNNYYYKN